MEARLVERGEFIVVGAAQAGKLGEFKYGEIWEKQYMPFDERLKPYSIDGGYYGATLCEKEALVYLAGMAVKGLPELPAGAEMRVIPAACYAVFDCTINTIGATWKEAYERWLPASGYELARDAVDFEYYPPYPGEGEMKVEIYIPIKKKGSTGFYE